MNESKTKENKKNFKESFFQKMSVCPPGTEAANSPCPAAKKRATGTRARSNKSPAYGAMEFTTMI